MSAHTDTSFLLFLCFVLLLPMALSLEEDLIKCCSMGRKWAENQRNGCDSFPVPIDGIPVQAQTLCVSSMEICCVEIRRHQQCQLGLKAGRAGRQCLRLGGDGGQSFKDCCLGCKLGLQVSAQTEDCGHLASSFAQPWTGAFTRCCEEILNGTFTKEIERKKNKQSLNVDEATRLSLTEGANRCPNGFRYNSRLNVCDDVDECAEGEEVHECDAQFETCVNTIGDYICEELEPEGHEEECPKGFRFFLISCIDIDECAESLHDCPVGKVCANRDGGFDCVRQEQFNQQISCPTGYKANSTTGECEDLNECKNGQHECLASQRCDNTMGSYACVRYTNCGTGYTLNYDTGRCEDDDECATGTHNCEHLGAGYLCMNMQGSFRCEKRRCAVGEILDSDGRCTPLRCQNGFEPGTSGSCRDIDECRESDGAICRRGERCENTMGSYRCSSQCELGLALDSVTNRCQDVDECTSGLGACFGGRTCVNTVGSYKCECGEGFKPSRQTGQCEDIDECARSVCGIDSECQNSPGSYRCVCKQGFHFASGVCGDVNECQEIPGICQQRCTNLWGSYRCHCQPGFRLSSDSRTCVDVDECEDYDDLCIGNCVNTPGSYECSCPQGYTLSSNGRSCQDTDECRMSQPCRGARQKHCFNTRGGYKCNDVSCPEGYVREEGHQTRCRRVSTKCKSGDLPCLRQPVSISYNFIALISNLRVRGAGVNLFTMQSARYRMLTTKFTLTVKSVRAPAGVAPATAEHFRLKTGAHSAILSIVKPIEGPQDVLLELLMEMYHLGRYQASAAANVNIFVTPYEF